MMSAEEISIEDEIAALMNNPEADPAVAVVESEPESTESGDPAQRDEKGRFAKKSDVVAEDAGQTEVDQPKAETTVVANTATTEPPQGVPAAIKNKWANLDPEVQQALVKREEDIHKMFTRNDGELNLGRKMKDVITPYMPIIKAEGGDEVSAVQSLLNTAYVLRTGSPQQKSSLFQAMAKAYGVDLGAQSQSAQDPNSEIATLRQELEQLRQVANPEAIERRLQDKLENDIVNKEVAAFASDPSNVHFDAVRPQMAALLQSGAAKDLREAYEMAIWSKPDLRSTFLAKQKAEEEAKRKTEVEAKKKAAMSVTGSAGKPSSTSAEKPKSLEDELRELMSEG